MLTIIGGGLGGLTAALAVARTGRAVRVLEKEDRFGEIGAGIQLAPNATRVLAGLGVLDDVERVAVRLRRIVMMHTETGRRLTSLDLGDRFLAHYGAPYLVLHRGDLLDILLRACAATGLVELESGKEVTSVTEDGHVTCVDGTEYESEAVVAADGLRSVTRRLLSDDEPIRWDYVAFRGTLPIEEVDAGADEEVIWIGPGRHVVQYPIRRGELYNQVAVFHGAPERIDDVFATSCDPVRAAVARLGRDRHWDMYDREPLGTWTRGRVALLGDAAHPMVQYLAQGACQAIEDADALGRRLAENPETLKALDAYATERIPRAGRVQYAARWWGDLWHDKGDMIAPLRDRVLAARAADDYSELDWLYGR